MARHTTNTPPSVFGKWFRSLSIGFPSRICQFPRSRGSRRSRTVDAEQLESRQLLTGFVYDSVVTIGDDVNVTRVNSLTVDDAGNHYITGSFQGTVDFDANSSLPENADVVTSLGDRASIFAAKYYSGGGLEWVRVMGSDTTGVLKSEQGLSIDVDASGNSYISGTFYYTAQFGELSVTSNGGQDAFIAKLAPTGDVLWVNSWGTTGSEAGNAVQVTQDGDVVLVGAGSGVQTIQKYAAADGTSLWSKSYDGSSLGVGAKIAEDTSGNLFVTNAFGSSPIDVDPSPSEYLIDHGVGSQGTYVIKLTSQADLIWARTFETLASSPYGRNYPTALAVDQDGNVVVSGFYSNLVDLNSSPTGSFTLPQVSAGGFVARLSDDGELDWAVLRSGGSSDLSIAEDGTIFSIGNSLVVISADGIVQNELVLTDGGAVQVRTGAVDDSGRVHSAGYFSGTADFDPGAGEDLHTALAQTGFIQTIVADPGSAGPASTLLFSDSFEVGEWNGKWVEDSQNDWFRSTQRSTTGSYSAEVDGSASNAALTTANVIDLSGMASATLTFDWLIESGFDAGEYLSLDISTNGGSSWIQDVRRLNGNVSVENTWHHETVDLSSYMSAELKIRFRSKVSASDEDANVDNVRIVGIADGPNAVPVADAGTGYAMNEGDSVTLSGSSSFDSDGAIVSYAWDLDNDGQFDDASGVSVAFSTTASGSHTVSLQVKDDRGATASATTNVVVANIAPTANAGADVSGVVGNSVPLSAAGSTDPGQDIISFAWDLDHDGQFDDASGVNATFTAAASGSYVVSVLVTDADGATSVDQVVVTINEAPSEVVLFEDSFEVSEWSGKWVEDSQNDWFRSSQRATDGTRSAEVDGLASNATLTLATSLNTTGYSSVILTFDWLIENGFDAGEYLTLDISTNGGSTWVSDVRRLNGNVSSEDVWHHESVDLTPYASASLRIRFRSSVSSSTEDANVDNVRIAGSNSGMAGSMGSAMVVSSGQQGGLFAERQDALNSSSIGLISNAAEPTLPGITGTNAKRKSQSVSTATETSNNTIDAAFGDFDSLLNAGLQSPLSAVVDSGL